MGRHMRTLLSTAETLPQLNSDLKTTARSLAARKRLEGKQYNGGTKNLIPLKVGEAIRMKLPGEQKWSSGHCSHLLGRYSYEVEVDGRCFRRHRHQLRSTLEPSPVPCSNNEEPHQTEDESRSPPQTENENRSPVVPEPVPDQCQTPSAWPENDTLSPAHSFPDSTESVSVLLPRHSRRTRHTPTWLEDYDLC